MEEPSMSTVSTFIENTKGENGTIQEISPSFNNARRKFRNRLQPKEIESFKITTIQDVLDAIQIIQAQQDPQKGLMDMTRLKSFLEAMTQLGEVVEVFLNTSEAIAFVWGPVKFLLQMASTWTHSLDTLLDAYQEIGNTVPLLKQYEALFKGNPHLLKVVEMIYEDILTFHQSALKFFSDKTWKQLFKSAWKTFDSKFKHILDGLRNHNRLLISHVNVIHLQQYESDRIRAQASFDRIYEKLLQEDLVATRHWLGGGQAKVYHRHACGARKYCPDTGAWILKQEKISTWLLKDRPERPIVWMHGIPGAGKTVLASVIIQHLLESQANSTAYCYAKQDDREGNTAVSVIRSLLSQSIVNDPDLIPYFHDFYSTSHEPSLTNLDNAKALLTLVCQRPGRKYFVVDGIDECVTEEYKNLLTILTRMIEKIESQEPGKIRLLIVSQDEPDIRRHVATATHLSIRSEDNESDIESFVTKKCTEIGTKFNLKDDQERSICQLICHKARGMFLYATLVTKNLYSLVSTEELRSELKADRFPEGLEQAYQRILHRIKTTSSKSEWRTAQKLLGWMICAKRSFKWREMQGAISIRQDGDDADFSARKLRKHIKDICGSLLLILPGDRVVLVHSTAAQYIMSSQYIHREVVECQMASLCFKYMTMPCFTENDMIKIKRFALNGSYAFQNYAFAKWYHHLRCLVEQLTVRNFQHSEESFRQELGDALYHLCETADEFQAEHFGQDSDDVTLNTTIEIKLQLPREILHIFKIYDIEGYHAMQNLWIHAIKHQAQDVETKNRITIKNLANALERSRKAIEELTIESRGEREERAKLDEFYGENRYTCPKLTCFYFHEGFRTYGERKTHINKHERPFQCTFSDCHAAEFGYSSQKDLDKHVRSVHPEFEDQANVFPEPPPQPISSKYNCNTCGKGFTRNLILKSHLLTHSGEKPHSCSYCGKAFTRLNDKKRHERTIHESRMHR